MFTKNFQGLEFNTPGDLDIGVISSLEECPDSPTGYRMGMLIRSRERFFDVTREVYAIKLSPEFDGYPCLGEYFFVPVLEDGIVTRLVNVNDIEAEGNPITTGLSIGTYAMFTKPITADTPQLSEIVSISGGTVTIEAIEDKELTYLRRGGAMPEPKNGMSFRLAPDADVYTWDWGLSPYPFAKVSLEEAARREYPDHFSVGSLEDINRGCYWLSFYSTRGDESVCDMVNIFLNKAPGWVIES